MLFFLQLLVQVSELAVLKDHVDVSLFIEVSIELHNVGMVKPPLYFEFSFHLREKVELFQHTFVNDLEGNWEF